MVFFGGVLGELDDGSRTVEHLATTVKDKVVVGGDEGEGDGDGGAEF